MSPQAAAPPDGTGILLREMRWWDIDPVLALEDELFPEDAWSAGMFWSELAHARGPFATRRYLVAEAPDGRLAGYGGLAAVAGTGDIQTIGVLPAHRGTGLGARLLRALLRAATDFECGEVLLEVRVDNAPAQRLYERFGFVPIGIRRGYYQPANVDALVMRLADPADAAPATAEPSAPPEPAAPADPPEPAGPAEPPGSAAYAEPPEPAEPADPPAPAGSAAHAESPEPPEPAGPSGSAAPPTAPGTPPVPGASPAPGTPPVSGPGSEEPHGSGGAPPPGGGPHAPASHDPGGPAGPTRRRTGPSAPRTFRDTRQTTQHTPQGTRSDG